MELTFKIFFLLDIFFPSFPQNSRGKCIPENKGSETGLGKRAINNSAKSRAESIKTPMKRNELLKKRRDNCMECLENNNGEGI